jgi:acetyl esterase/lipase
MVKKNSKEEMNVFYGKDQRQSMDIYYPDVVRPETPTVLLLHGGGFVAGSRHQFTPIALQMRDKGFIAVNISYRLVDTSGMYSYPPQRKKSDVTLQSQVDDIHAAYLHVLKCTNSPTSKVYIAGHSAGATLGLLYALSSFNDDNHVIAAGNWAGGLDLSLHDTTFLSIMNVYIKEVMTRAVGKEPVMKNNEYFKTVSPLWLLHEHQGFPTISIYPEHNIVLHYPNEAAIGLVQTENFHQLLKDKEIKEKLILYKGSDHSFGQSGTREKVVEDTVAFFKGVK